MNNNNNDNNNTPELRSLLGRRTGLEARGWKAGRAHTLPTNHNHIRTDWHTYRLSLSLSPTQAYQRGIPPHAIQVMKATAIWKMAQLIHPIPSQDNAEHSTYAI